MTYIMIRILSPIAKDLARFWNWFSQH